FGLLDDFEAPREPGEPVGPDQALRQGPRVGRPGRLPPPGLRRAGEVREEGGQGARVLRLGPARPGEVSVAPRLLTRLPTGLSRPRRVLLVPVEAQRGGAFGPLRVPGRFPRVLLLELALLTLTVGLRLRLARRVLLRFPFVAQAGGPRGRRFLGRRN